MYPTLKGYTRLENEDDDLPSYSSSLKTKSTRRKDKKYTSVIDSDDEDIYNNYDVFKDASAPVVNETLSLPPKSNQKVKENKRCERCGINGTRYYLLNLNENWCYDCSTIIKEKIEIPVMCEMCNRSIVELRYIDNENGIIMFICYECKNNNSALSRIKVKKNNQTSDCIIM
jgi:hypothetical protein